MPQIFSERRPTFIRAQLLKTAGIIQDNKFLVQQVPNESRALTEMAQTFTMIKKKTVATSKIARMAKGNNDTPAIANAHLIQNEVGYYNYKLCPALQMQIATSSSQDEKSQASQLHIDS